MPERFDRVLRAGWHGFTLVEVVVALVIILVLAAVALPTLDGYLQQKRVDAAADQLNQVSLALYDNTKGANAFAQVIGSNAGRLSELSTPILQGNSAYDTGTDNSCGGTFSKGEQNKWDGAGPFVNFLVSRDSGMVTPIGQASDSLTRIPNSNNNGVLRINFVNSVSLEDAILLDATADGSTGNAAGSVQWTLPAVSGYVTMYFFVPINNKC